MKLLDKIKDLVEASADATALDLNDITLENGTISESAVLKFVKCLPDDWQEVLLEQDHPTDVAYARCLAACLLKGYGDANLVHLARRKLSSDASFLLHALACIAHEAVTLETLPDGYDIRGILAEAVALSIDETEQGKKLANYGIDKSNVDKLILDTAGPRTCSQAVYAMKCFIADHSANLDELIEESIELVWAIKDSSKLDSLEVTCIDKAFKQASYSHDHVFERHCMDPDVGPDPFLQLSSLFKPKMSLYMNRFWDHQCDSFFESSTRDDFLDFLRRYRKTLHSNEYLITK